MCLFGPGRIVYKRDPSDKQTGRQGNAMGLGRPAEPGRHQREDNSSGQDEEGGKLSAPRESRRRRNRSASPIKLVSEDASESSESTLPTLTDAHAYFMRTFGPSQRPAPDLNVFLTRKIMRFARRWRAIANEHLSAIGQTQARWEALYWIAVSQGGATQRELAECVGIEEPTLVRMLHRLEQEGLVERRASQEDRRTKTIVLTQAAAPHLKAMSNVIDGLREEVLQGIPAEDITKCVEVLDKLLERLERP
jgi:MarR family transcriptional regulator, transcriptional regulator for hemolysin